MDHFLIDLFTVQGASPELHTFLKKIFILFHGNSAVERSFSVNKDFLVENLTENSLIAQRSVHDAVENAGGFEKINISEGMILEFKNASAKRVEALKKKKGDEDKKSADKKQAAEELKKIKIKSGQIKSLAQEEIKLLELKAEKLKKLIS